MPKKQSQIQSLTWAIEPGAFAEFQQSIALLAKQPIPADSAISVNVDTSQEEDNRIYTEVGKTGVIDIAGILLPTAPRWARYWGLSVTGYDEIIDGLARAENNEAIEEVLIRVASPGGQIVGHHRVVNAIKAFTKPTTAYIPDYALSAAYGLAVQADKVIAGDRSTLLGSVGALRNMVKFDFQYDVASSNAPNKAPDVTTESGRAVIQGSLDKIVALFIEDIALGRSTTIETVEANYGKGDIVPAPDALAAGMIDEIEELSQADNTNNVNMMAQDVAALNTKTTAVKNTGGQKEVFSMKNLEELASAEPVLYAQAIAKGIAQGVTSERQRADDHLKAGALSPAEMVVAKAAIASGKTFAECAADYHVAARNVGDITARQDDEDLINPGTAATETANITSDKNQKAAFDKALAQGLNIPVEELQNG